MKRRAPCVAAGGDELPRALPERSPSGASARSPAAVPRSRPLSPRPAHSADWSDSSPGPTRAGPEALLDDCASTEPATTGRKRRSPFVDELRQRRQRTELAYAEQLQSLATAARTLEGMLRLADGAGAAESALGQTQLEGLLVAAVCDVRALLEQDRRQREQLRQELRAVAAAFKSCPTPPAQAEAQLEAATLRCELLRALTQLQAERQAGAAIAKAAARQHEGERCRLLAQLRRQAAEMKLLATGYPTTACHRLEPAASLRAPCISLPELLPQHD